MRFDVDLHRYTIKLPDRLPGGRPLEMSVVDSGAHDAAQTMVFIHGFGGRAAYWESQLEHFQADYRVIALDLRGHGYTDAPTEAEGSRYDVPELVADVEAALDLLQVPQRFILVCHSFGGALSSYFLKKHPERVSALVIVSSAVRFRLRWAGRMVLRIPPAILNRIRNMLPYVGFNAARIYPPAHVVYLQNRNGLAVWDGTEYLRAIRIPTMVILGQRDILFSQTSYKEVARLVPDVEEVVIPVSAHQVMVERPDAVNRSIERFLHAQTDPLTLLEHRTRKKTQRRAALKALEAERPWLKFYDTRTPYRIKPPTVALPRLLEATARRFARTPAVEYFGGKLDWRSIDRLANRFAHGLLALRIKPGEPVMLALPNTPNWIIAYYGILKMGGIAVLTDAATDKETLFARIADTKAVMLVTSSDRYQGLRSDLQTDERNATLRRVVFASRMDHMGWREKTKFALLHNVQDGHWLPWFVRDKRYGKRHRRYVKFQHVLARGRNYPPEITLSVDDTAAIVYSYGRSGPSLPIPLTHRNLASNALQLRHWLPESRPGAERFLAQQPLSLAYGLTGLLHLGVYLGATLILMPETNIPLLLKTIKKLQPTYFPTTPPIIQQLAQVPGVRKYGLASIRVCAVGGAPLPLEIREMFEKITRGRLVEAYGLAEASPAVIAMPLAGRRQSGVVGLPLPDTEAKIVDLDSGAALEPEQVGELWVRGPQVFAGYGGSSERSAAAPPSPQSSPASGRGSEREKQYLTPVLHDGWLATGDIASMDENGFFTIVERKENMLLRNGLRIFPRQIEDALYEHPAIALARVLREKDEQGVVRLRALVKLHRNLSSNEEELMKYCAKRLHPGALPDSISFESGEDQT
ncbi:MAG: alpha/beta fold hydrolase [Nitrosomonadales bacterium]|nr:alpha/beta fold hydrolase [Nitrosomonadales bacterium]